MSDVKQHCRIKPRRLYEQPARECSYINIGDLQEYMKNRPPKPDSEFKPCVRYSEDGDFFEVYWKPDMAYAEDDDKGNTWLKAIDTGEIVGMKIHGVKHRMGLVEIKQ